MSSTYQPKEWEQQIYQEWLEHKIGEFKSQNADASQTHCILMPPPNLTGQLHAGHAFQHYLMDSLSRYARQQGKLDLWYPGVDHAGIQLEGVIDKLIKKGDFDDLITSKIHISEVPKDELPTYLKDKHRDIWLECAWQKVEEWRNNQKDQAAKLGDTPSWDKQLFTLDERATRMVMHAFKEYWKDGLIYKGEYMINWSVGLQTALSDFQQDVEWVEQKDPFVTFGYQLSRIERVNNHELDETTQSLIRLSLSEILVSTVRPETVWGDVAVAIHPAVLEKKLRTNLSQEDADSIYNDILQGHIHLFYNLGAFDSTFEAQLVVEQKVDPDFGTGALKITPAHSPDDFDFYSDFVSKNLIQTGFKQVIERDGKLNSLCGAYAGMTVAQSRNTIIKDMIAAGIVPAQLDENGNTMQDADGTTMYQVDWNYSHNVLYCERSKTQVEPFISTEYFLSYHTPSTQKGKNLIEIGRQGVSETTFYPSSMTERANTILDDLHDWCISRSLVWGHQIPVWYNLDLNPSKTLYPFVQEYINVQNTSYHRDQLVCVQEEIPQSTGNWVREEKILDTWFSSCLWPLTTLDFYDTLVGDNLRIGSYSEATQPELETTHFKPTVHACIKNIRDNTWIFMRDEHHDCSNFDYYPIGGKIEDGEDVLETLRREMQEETQISFDQLTDISIVGYTDQHFCLPESLQGKPAKNKHMRSTIVYAEIELDTLPKFEESEMKAGQYAVIIDEDTLLKKGSLLPGFQDALQHIKKWKQQESDFERFYPTQTLTTGTDIFYAWIVRMIILSTYWTGKSPFEKLVITPTILDEKGKKMSKSLGNGLEPVQQIDRYSSDALRMALLGGMIPARNVRMGGQLADRLTERYRNFGNKLWNIARFLESKQRI